MPTFDVVSKVQWNEVDNALNQADREIQTRFDFKDTGTTIEKNSEGISISSSSEDRAKAAVIVFHEKLIKRKVSLKYLDQQKSVPTSKGGSRILIKVKEGIDVDAAKKMVAGIKEAKLKVQAAIMDQQLRVSGKNKDDLQATIQFLRAKDFGCELQFNNFRE